MDNGNPGVERGFAVWMEPESLHYHTGIVQARILWGRMMQREGAADAGGWSCYALDPEGEVLEADIAPGEGTFHKAAFFAHREGLYSLVLDYDAGVYLIPGEVRALGEPGDEPGGAVKAVRYYQRARLPVPVGHHMHGRLENLEAAGLDVFCSEFREYRPGDSIVVSVFYKGKPLAGAEIKATYHLYTGTEYPWRGITGKDGSASFTFSDKGHWMFTCTHSGADSDAGNSQTVNTSTFVVAGVR